MKHIPEIECSNKVRSLEYHEANFLFSHISFSKKKIKRIERACSKTENVFNINLEKPLNLTFYVIIGFITHKNYQQKLK